MIILCLQVKSNAYTNGIFGTPEVTVKVVAIIVGGIVVEFVLKFIEELGI